LSVTDDLNPSTALILANAVYFKGKWANEFDPKATMNRPFHINSDIVMDVPTMFRKGSYKYADLPKYDAKCIELPYAVIFFSSKNKFFFETSFCELIREQQSSKKLTKSEIDHFSVCFV